MFETAELGEHLDDLYRFALAITRNPDLAGDLVHDTVVRAIERRDQFRGDAPLGGWLRRILHNLAIDRVRRSAREVAVEEVEEKWHDNDYTVDPEAVAERVQTREELEDALVRLPFAYRTAVVLHDAEEWKVREIAEVQGVSLPAAKQRLRRGRMMLVDALAEGHERRMMLKEVPMRCWDARKHVSDYLDGVLGPDTALMVESHLEVCPTCPPLYAALVDAHTGLAGHRDPDSVIPPDVRARVLALR
ncbi:MAG: sigma-70 family RNA polymerase sigma factor [Acidimicrobiia bacterium]|nr:sigma-70 family RNA polymerase sigma factor [Acidimicrobiia bacterium]